MSYNAAHIAKSYRKRLSAKHHLGKVPEPKLWLGEGHAFREGARKLDKKHEQQIKRQMQTQKQKVQPLKAQLKTELKDVKKLKAQYKKLKAKKAKPSEAELRSELSTEMKQRDILKAELKSEKLKAKVQPWGQ